MDLMSIAQLLGNIGEFVGAVAVVVTLAYLAVQVRYSREATEANTKSLRSVARFESGRYWSEETIRMALSPDMASIVAAGFEDASQLGDNDRERLVAWFLQHVLMKDTLYHQYLDGIFPEEAWKAHEQVTIGAIQTDAWCRVWDAGLCRYLRSFGSTSKSFARPIHPLAGLTQTRLGYSTTSNPNEAKHEVIENGTQ